MKKIFMVEVEKIDVYRSYSYNYLLISAKDENDAIELAKIMYSDINNTYEFYADELFDVEYTGNKTNHSIIGMW